MQEETTTQNRVYVPRGRQKDSVSRELRDASLMNSQVLINPENTDIGKGGSLTIEQLLNTPLHRAIKNHLKGTFDSRREGHPTKNTLPPYRAGFKHCLRNYLPIEKSRFWIGSLIFRKNKSLNWQNVLQLLSIKEMRESWSTVFQEQALQSQLQMSTKMTVQQIERLKVMVIEFEYIFELIQLEREKVEELERVARAARKEMEKAEKKEKKMQEKQFQAYFVEGTNQLVLNQESQISQVGEPQPIQQFKKTREQIDEFFAQKLINYQEPEITFPVGVEQ